MFASDPVVRVISYRPPLSGTVLRHGRLTRPALRIDPPDRYRTDTVPEPVIRYVTDFSAGFGGGALGLAGACVVRGAGDRVVVVGLGFGLVVVVVVSGATVVVTGAAFIVVGAGAACGAGAPDTVLVHPASNVSPKANAGNARRPRTVMASSLLVSHS